MKFSSSLYKCLQCGEFFYVPNTIPFSEDDIDCPVCGIDCTYWLRYGSISYDNPKTIKRIIEVYNETERAERK